MGKKEEFRCFNIFGQEKLVDCDDECVLGKKETLRSKEKSDSHDSYPDEHARREAEIFEKQLEGGKRKRRNRRKEIDEVEVDLFSRKKMYGISAIVLLSVIVGLYFYTSI